MAQDTLAYMNAWPKRDLESLAAEYELEGLIISGNVKLKAEQIKLLVDYLHSTPADDYGNVQLDFALFYREDGNKPAISGKLTTPYIKGDDAKKTTTKATSKRKL